MRCVNRMPPRSRLDHAARQSSHRHFPAVLARSANSSASARLRAPLQVERYLKTAFEERFASASARSQPPPIKEVMSH